jgi:RNA polymerase sigma-B factor
LQERSIEVARTSEEMSQRLNRPPAVHELAEMLDLSEQDVTEAIEVRQAYVSSSVDKPSETTGLTILESIEDPELSIHLADQRLLVEEALGELPERQKRILHLRFNEDMTQSEIADVVGISQMHVSRLLASALETLRSAIGEESRS